MSENKEEKLTAEQEERNEEYSLNDDRRVKSLSPGALVIRRFIRNRVAVVGLIILIFMFLFSFVGGMISPYEEDQLFYRTELHSKDYAAVTENNEYRYAAKDDRFGTMLQVNAMLAISSNADTFSYEKLNYTLTKEGDEFYSVSIGDEVIGLVYKDIFFDEEGNTGSYDFETLYAALKAYFNGESSFTADGVTYDLDEDGNVTVNGEASGYIGRYIVKAAASDVVLTREWKEELLEVIQDGKDEFVYTGTDGETYEYELTYDAGKNMYSVKQEQETTVYDTYSYPSREHWLGTDKNGMDMLTRLMYGGRISLMVGFIVEIISTVLGVILGGVAGYFGGWVDMLIMRIVDVFYCVPSMPLIIILGSVMDTLEVDPSKRILLLMFILGFLGWAGIARMVRGQILSLREQEYMTAAEATGLSVKRRIFRHLIPNVIPQLIVSMTMGLGSTIITEATLSFLGLGVKFPYASWGNIINDVNNTFVLTNYWFIWIPAGVLLLLTVLAFNLVGDGLRDAFDPRMKR